VQVRVDEPQLVGAANADDSSTSSDLNLPGDLFYLAGELVPARGGPNRGYGSCYKPGCSASDLNNPNAPQACIGP
jgi:hypothetical protein